MTTSFRILFGSIVLLSSISGTLLWLIGYVMTKNQNASFVGIFLPNFVMVAILGTIWYLSGMGLLFEIIGGLIAYAMYYYLLVRHFGLNNVPLVLTALAIHLMLMVVALLSMKWLFNFLVNG